MTDYTQIYIDGNWIPSAAGGQLEVFDSTNGAVLGSVPSGAAADVDAAAAAARRAFPSWSTMATEERGKYLTRVADALDARSAELLDVIIRETGMAKAPSQVAQVAAAIGSFRVAAEIAETFVYEEEIGNSLVIREPIGVARSPPRSPTPWLPDAR